MEALRCLKRHLTRRLYKLMTTNSAAVPPNAATPLLT